MKKEVIRYDNDFKARALYKLSTGLSIRKVALQLGVSPITIKRWVQKANKLTNAFENTLSPTTINAEDIRKLQQKISLLERDKETLKEALTILLRANF